MSAHLFSKDFKETPYWWDESPRPALPERALPADTDVLVVGSGYTGLSAALELSRGGRNCIIVDAEAAGWGCSTRNGGQISTSIKPDFDALSAKYGPDAAKSILKEGHAALNWIRDFVSSEGIDCNFMTPGRFHAAHNPKQYEKLARQLEKTIPDLPVPAYLVPREEQHRHIGTDAYYGGVVFENHASLDPGKFHQGLTDRVLQAGASIVPHCRVNGIRRDGALHEVATSKGVIRARDVVIATNGYTGPESPWLRRRVIPIGSYVIATEALESEVMDRLLPTNRILSDTRKVVFYYRPSPDRSRILFGGRVSIGETDPRRSGPKLHECLTRLFPDLKTAKISHSWMGFVAYTFDTLAHIGQRDGLYFAMGYCGSGVSMAGYLGMKIGKKILGDPEGATGFDSLNFQSRPLYYGKPWFLAPSVAYYQWLDSLNR